MSIDSIEDLNGQTIVEISYNNDGLDFIVFDGEQYRSYNLSGSDGPPNDCHVWLESVVGDLQDLVGEPLLKSEIATNTGSVTHRSGEEDHGTWTFYKFATRKGYVDVRFCGTSNGYYSEKADLHGGRVVDKEFVEERLKNKRRFTI